MTQTESVARHDADAERSPFPDGGRYHWKSHFVHELSDEPIDALAMGWARSTWAAPAPFATGGMYLDVAGLGEDERLRAVARGPNEARPEQIRRCDDPDGLFGAAAHRP